MMQNGEQVRVASALTQTPKDALARAAHRSAFKTGFVPAVPDLENGFATLVNTHQLDHKKLGRRINTCLGDWINDHHLTRAEKMAALTKG